MGPLAFLSVAVGAALGALLRWAFGLALNAWVPEMPLGTLAANLLGGFVIGAAIGAFAQFQTLPPELRLFVTTGFCGGLTTFSTFSAETVTLLLRQQYGWAATVIVSHLAGSLLMTFAGVFAVRAMFRT